MYEGERLKGHENPTDLDMEDGDQIQALIEQQGGFFWINFKFFTNPSATILIFNKTNAVSFIKDGCWPTSVEWRVDRASGLVSGGTGHFEGEVWVGGLPGCVG